MSSTDDPRHSINPPAGRRQLAPLLAFGTSIVLYVRSAQQLGAVRSHLLFSSAPFFGVMLSWLALREQILPGQLGAAVLMVFAVVLLHQERHEHAHSHLALTHTHWHRHDGGHHAHLHREAARSGHVHEHEHDALVHTHAHRPDLHHRHEHD